MKTQNAGLVSSFNPNLRTYAEKFHKLFPRRVTRETLWKNSAYVRKSTITMKNTQPIFPGVSDWTQPQTAHGSELAQLIARANAAGFRAHRMTVKRPAIYELNFFREQLAITTP